jgi:hypothetical protein
VICKEMGWSYWDLMELPADVYDVLVEMLSETFKARAAQSG